MSYFKNVFLIVLLLSSIISFAQNEEFDTLSTESYSIEHPKHWTVDESGTMGTLFFIYDAPTHDSDLFSENVNLMIDDRLSDTITVQDYGKASLELLPKYIQGYEFISSNSLQQNDVDVFILEYKGKSGTFDLQFKQLVVAKDDTFYIVTFTMEQSQVEAYEKIAQTILDSFKIIE